MTPGGAPGARRARGRARARSRARCCCGCTACRDEAAAVAQAVAVLGDGAQLPLVAALAGLDERGGRRGDRCAGAGGHPAPRAAARLRAPARPRRRLPRPAAPASGSSATPRRRGCCRRRSAPAEEVATQLLACPRRGRGVGRRRPRRGGRVGAGQGRRGQRRRLPRARARGAAAAGAARPGSCSQLGLAETLTSGPAAADHLREAWEALEDPRERARVAATLAPHARLHRAARRKPSPFARRAAAEMPPELVDERQALRAHRADAIPLGVGRRGGRGAARATSDSRATGPARRCSRPRPPSARALTGAPAEECVALAKRGARGRRADRRRPRAASRPPRPGCS